MSLNRRSLKFVSDLTLQLAFLIASSFVIPQALSAQVIERFGADSDRSYGPIRNPETSDFPTQNWTFCTRDSQFSGSVRLEFTGPNAPTTRTENLFPFCAGGDNSGDLNPLRLQAGSQYSVRVRAFSAKKVSGSVLSDQTPTIQVPGTPPPASVQAPYHVQLFTAPQDGFIKNLGATENIDLANLSRAIYTDHSLSFSGSVRFQFGNLVDRMESYGPYCLTGDNGAQSLNPVTASPEVHQLRVTVYSQKSRAGNLIGEQIISITVPSSVQRPTAEILFANILAGGRPSETEFRWDFGDPGSPYNQVRGFNASHIYNNPGTYTVRLTVKTKSLPEAVATRTVTIASNTRPNFYIDAVAGNDQSSGRSTSSAWRTIRPLLQQTCTSRNVYFKRGQTHILEEAQGSRPRDRVKLCSNSRYGAYGSGNLPVIEARHIFQDPFRTHIFPEPNQENIIVENLHFSGMQSANRDSYGDYNYDGTVTNFFDVGGVTLRDLRFSKLQNVFFLKEGAKGILIQNNGVGRQADGSWSADSVKHYFASIFGSQNVAFYGNRIKISRARGEPTIRTCTRKTEKISLIGNEIYGDARNKNNPLTFMKAITFIWKESFLLPGRSIQLVLAKPMMSVSRRHIRLPAWFLTPITFRKGI